MTTHGSFHVHAFWTDKIKKYLWWPVHVNYMEYIHVSMYLQRRAPHAKTTTFLHHPYYLVRKIVPVFLLHHLYNNNVVNKTFRKYKLVSLDHYMFLRCLWLCLIHYLWIPSIYELNILLSSYVFTIYIINIIHDVLVMYVYVCICI